MVGGLYNSIFCVSFQGGGPTCFLLVLATHAFFQGGRPAHGCSQEHQCRRGGRPLYLLLSIFHHNMILTHIIILVSSRSDNNGGLATNVWADLLKRHDPSLPRLLQEPEAEEGLSREKSFST